MNDVSQWVGRFWASVDKTGECWVWTAGKTQKGYGSFYGGGRLRRAHRTSWELANGPIPDGLFVCHRCDNRPCVRPDHLFLGTAKDNMDDARAKGRPVRVFPSGESHPSARLTGADVVAILALRGTATAQQIAARFGTSRTTVQSVWAGTKWRSVVGAAGGK